MKEKIWLIPYERPEAPEALLASGYPPLLAAVLKLRGVVTPEQARRLLDGGEETLHDPLRMKGMAAAAERLRRAIKNKETVAVYGDYDVDGITATCLLTDYLKSKGLRCIPYIPSRDGEGYGLNCTAVEALHGQGVELLISVDCGITAAEEVAFARSLGMDVVITDHHECGAGPLPEACAVVDPKQEGETYPNACLAGVGVALKLACACEGDSRSVLERCADLVAVGTVADVMPLLDENRTLVRMGLEKLRRSPRLGFAAMLGHAGVDIEHLTASSIGFGVAPRLNAAGRLGQTDLALRLLLTEDPAEADELAAALCELNRKRQSIENEIWLEASRMLEKQPPDGPIVLASDRWHQGVIGIAASRLAEQYSLPTVMICLSGDHGKGSCRSCAGFNLFEALSACSDCLTGFGGHALAAGLNLRADRVDEFRAALRDYYLRNRPAPAPEVLCDLLITEPSWLSEENVLSLDELEPYGSENPRPVLCLSGVTVEALSAVGGGKHLRLRVSLRGVSFEGIFFSHTAQELGLREGERADLAFTPQINDFRGRRSVQLLVSAARPHRCGELCASLLRGETEALWAAAPWLPDRGEFIRVWRLVEKEGFALGGTVEEALSQRPEGMEPECFCLCLRVLREAGLLEAPGQALFGAKPFPSREKVDLDATPLMRLLRGC
ncbi:MAG: single-stranded-DNA-specific exonuclease RecJ [Oscillospiraceae bacterium]|nr:single-stranded-DNA-specific exonuclease RecJ [Oscillospiraceae bacterium]